MQPSSGADNRIVPAGNSRRGTSAQVLRAIAIGLALGMIFGSDALRRWTEQLPDSSVTAMVQTAAARWNAAMAAVGATRPYAALRAAVRASQAMRF